MRSAMRAASQLPGRVPTVVDMACTCTLIKNLMMMMMMMVVCVFCLITATAKYSNQSVDFLALH